MNLNCSKNKLDILKELLELRDIITPINYAEVTINNKSKEIDSRIYKITNYKNMIEDKELPNYNAVYWLYEFVKSEFFNKAIVYIANKDISVNIDIIREECEKDYSFTEAIPITNSVANFSKYNAYLTNLTFVLCQLSIAYRDSNRNFDVISTLKEMDNNSSFNFDKCLEGNYLSHSVSKACGNLKKEIENIYTQELFKIAVRYNGKIRDLRKQQLGFFTGESKRIRLNDEMRILMKERNEKMNEALHSIEIPYSKLCNHNDLVGFQKCCTKDVLTQFDSLITEVNAYKESNIEDNIKLLQDDYSIATEQTNDLAMFKEEIIDKYCTFVPIKYIFDEYAINYFIQYIYYEQADTIGQCINLYEHRELQEELIYSTESLKRTINNLKNAVVNELNKVNIRLATMNTNLRDINENMGTVINGQVVINDSLKTIGNSLNKVSDGITKMDSRISKTNELIAEGNSIQVENCSKLDEISNDTERLYASSLLLKNKCTDFIDKVRHEKHLEGKVYY